MKYQLPAYLILQKRSFIYLLIITGISVPPDENSKSYTAYPVVESSNYSPNIKYTDHLQTPVQHGTWPASGAHRVRFKATNQLLEEHPIYNTESVVDMRGSLQPPAGYFYNSSTDCIEIDQYTDTHSQEFVPGENHDMKYSTGSGDSGVHSNSPIIEDSLPHRHLEQQMDSIHELNQSHISVGSKKIRNETYV